MQYQAEDQPSLEQIDHIQCVGSLPKYTAQQLLFNGELKPHIDTVITSNSDHVAHYLPPFDLLPGEQTRYYSDFGKSLIVLTNYRWFASNDLAKRRNIFNVPLRCIESVEIRELFFLYLSCRDGRILKVGFDHNESCCAWFKYLIENITVPHNFELLFAFHCQRACAKSPELHHLIGYDYNWNVGPPRSCSDYAYQSENVLKAEFQRLNFNGDQWRITQKNKDWKLCVSYPESWIVPSGFSDEQLQDAVRYRAQGRVPAAIWRHRDNGAVLLRSSQPLPGIFSWRSECDEALLNKVWQACCGEQHNDDHTMSTIIGPDKRTKRLLIVDARSYMAALGNRAKGGGPECPEYYPQCDIEFLGLPNMHKVRTSFHLLRTLCASVGILQEPKGWLPGLEYTGWFHYLRSVLEASVRVMRALHDEGRPVLVHCSDGWDRTTQIVSLTKLLLDPYYRTLQGFYELVDREWMAFGHKFGDRSGLAKDINEHAPVFLQWLDCVHQIVIQFPCSFEFSSTYLVKLAQHNYSALFGTFLFNSLMERKEAGADNKTLSVWSYLHAQCNAQRFRNALYREDLRILWPRCDMKDLVLWWDLYCPHDPAEHRNRGRSHSNLALLDTSDHANMLKAHSYDNLVTATAFPEVIVPARTVMPRTGSESNLAQSPPSSAGGDLSLVAAKLFEAACPAIIERSAVGRTAVEQDALDAVHSLVDSVVSSTVKSILNEQVAAQSCSREIMDDEFIGGPLELDCVDGDVASAHCIVNGYGDQNGAVYFGNGVNSRRDRLDPCVYEHAALTRSDDLLSLSSTSTIPAVHRIVYPELAHMSTSTTDISCPHVSPTPMKISGSHRVPNGLPYADVPVYHKQNGRVRPRMAAVSHPNIGDHLDCDGLIRVPNLVQERVVEIQAQHQAHVDWLQSELMRLKLVLARHSHQCSSCNEMDDFRSNRNSVNESRSLESGAGSEVSWEAVDEGDTKPTLWIPDHAVSKCMGCDAEFWAIKRKHHCRNCGKVFCGSCSSFEYPVPNEQLYEPVRVCKSCYRNLMCKYPQQQQQQLPVQC